MKMKRSIVATLLSAFMAVPVLPQDPAPAAAPKGVTKFGATTQLVVVDVTVKDKSGNPIKGLKPSDFVVTEDGKKQDIKILTFQQLEETAIPVTAPPPSIKKQPAKEPDAAPAQPAVKSLTANQIAPSHRGEVKYKDRRLLVMFFDMTSMPVQDQVRSQAAAKKFISSQMTQSDLMAVMTFSSELKVQQDFTDDKDALQK